MTYHENTSLCLTYSEYTGCFGVEAYKSDKKRDKILLLTRGGNGKEVLIDYETLPDTRKQIILKKYGNPYKYVVKQPLKEWVELNRNEEAYKFYNNYTLPNGLKLPEAYRDKYTLMVTYIDAITYYTTDKIALKRDFSINMEAFWKIVTDVFTAEMIGLPKNSAALRRRIAEYRKAGFELLIEKWRFGNDNSKKVKDQVAEDTLMKLIEWDNKQDDVVIAATYNMWAVENNRQTITPATVGYRRRTKAYEVVIAREGKSAAYNKYTKQIKRHRATSPLMLINSDDNVLDLYFTHTTYSNGKKHVNRYYRPVMYVVIDTFNDYVLGYAVGETVTIELIKAAYRNAMQHVIELTGAPHLWHQIQTDKWSIDPALEGGLATFFKNQSIFFPAQVAQSKYIERVFSHPLHKVLKVFPNYSGANITARGANARPNTDALQKRSASFPDVQHAPAVIEMTINTMRHRTDENGVSKQQQWLTAFHESEFCKTRAITNDRKLELFGIKLDRKPDELPRLLAQGLNFQLGNKKYSFDVPASLFPEHHNKRVQVIYEPESMDTVLVTDGKGLRFLTSKYITQPAALADRKEGDGKMLDTHTNEKEEVMNKMIDFVTEREARLQRAGIDAHSLLQANVLTKAINHKAQKTITGSNEAETPQLPPVFTDAEYSYYDEM